MTKIIDVHDKKLSSERFESFVSTKEKIDVPHTNIQNRAQISDLSKLLAPNMGVSQRIMTRELVKVQNESSLSGVPIYGVTGDDYDQIRLVGNWKVYNNVNGKTIGTVTIDEYLEIVFYGTGLNLLHHFDADNRDYSVSLDGGVYSSNIVPQGGSAVLKNRNYTSNVILPVVNSLSLGLHTVRIRLNNGASDDMGVMGIEILNESSDVTINKGSAYIDGSKVSLMNQWIGDYKAGVVGVNGARVIKYLDNGGNVETAITEVGSPLYLLNTDHTNEEISRKYAWREFGCGRSDDFSLLTSIRGAAFTLGDNTVTLVSDSAAYAEGTDGGLSLSPDSSSLIFTFVGTGLRIKAFQNGTSTYNIYIDGTLQGAVGNGVDSDSNIYYDICSGLTYGTHVVKIFRNSGYAFEINEFIVYQPKKPSFEGMVIADYGVLADFIPNTNYGTEYISTGTVRKSPLREFAYKGSGWMVSGIATAHIGGFPVYSGTDGDSFEFTFFGTGIDYRCRANPAYASNIQVELNGETDFSSYNNSTYGGMSFTEATGAFSIAAGDTLGAGLIISGLPLGLHTVKFTRNTGSGNIILNSIDVIAPIHALSFKDGVNIASSVGDQREIKSNKEKIVAEARGIVNTPTNTIFTKMPIPDMWTSIYLEKRTKISITLDVCFRNSSAAGAPEWYIYVNGKQVQLRRIDLPDAGEMQQIVVKRELTLDKGHHFIQGIWHNDAATLYAQGYDRSLIVKEL